MNLDLGTTLIGTISAVICAAPFVLVTRSVKKKEKAMLRSLNDFADQDNCKIHEHEYVGDFIIGMDTTKNVVFFYRKEKDSSEKLSVDLKDVKNCHVSKIGKSVRHNGKVEQTIERIELVFTTSPTASRDVVFELFNTQNNLQLNGELQTAEKWAQKVNTIV
ncbi:hypothetical protein D9O36_15335 [Zobellia amurskyensis]|uniref:Uncharacterized protein n=1 Tax=Zobellia amurskyensis TaxID=248905 RepID=A0A7X2ZVK9_9FLAO|nr:hypothetical protein [Zobellia amurskyensis]MUH37223.1 hypothetical protein [Zobellia amurskyensis]